MDDSTLPSMPQSPRWQGRFAWLSRWWDRGPLQKIALIAFIPLFLACACCSGSLVFASTPYGQQIVAEGNATSTAQAALDAQATADARAYALAHPKPTATATNTPEPTGTPIPTATATAIATATAAATATSRPVPTATPRPAPTATPKPTCSTDGAPANPWCFTFYDTGKVIYYPPSAFCSYFNCIPSFWTYTNGYVEECVDGTYSHSGGVSGSCSHHGGNLRPLYQP